METNFSEFLAKPNAKCDPEAENIHGRPVSGHSLNLLPKMYKQHTEKLFQEIWLSNMLSE